MPAYYERLLPPLTWYLVAAGIVGSVFVAFVFATCPLAAILGASVAALAAAAVIVSQASFVRVDGDGTLTAGRSSLEAAYRGPAEPLDAEQTRAVLGAEADARAHLAVHGFCPTSVRVRVHDAADPHPYWVVSSRQPRRLATALGWRPQSSPEIEHHG